MIENPTIRMYSNKSKGDRFWQLNFSLIVESSFKFCNGQNLIISLQSEYKQKEVTDVWARTVAIIIVYTVFRDANWQGFWT